MDTLNFSRIINFSIFSVPLFSWVAVIVVIVWPAMEAFKLRTFLRKSEAIYRKLLSDIAELHRQYAVVGSHGLPLTAVNRLQQTFTENILLQRAWNIFRANLIYRSTESEDSDEEQVWSTESALTAFSEDSFLDINFNKRYFQAIPGIVTSIGLGITFLCILVGLLDVKVTPNNSVEGLGNLVGALSGKFTSSVFALASATIFLLFEKRIFHQLSKRRMTLVAALDNLIPRHSESQILNEICQNMDSQTTAFRTFNSDLSLRLRNSFSESIGPTLDRMVLAVDSLNQLTRTTQAELLDSIRDMNQLLQRAEETRQESISGQVGTLLEKLQESLSSSIDTMSKEFNRALVGTTQDQFSRVAETVGSTAEVLAGMNQRFNDTQENLQNLITLAKQSTENQYNNSSALIERMVGVLGGTLETMGQRITDLSDKMASTVADTAEKSARTAENVFTEVKNLSQQNVHKFLEVLSMHEEQVDKVNLLRQTLQGTIEELTNFVTSYNRINMDLKNISQETKEAMMFLSQSSQKLHEGQISFNKVADFAKVQLNSMETSHEQQRSLWNGINTSMKHYQSTFEYVEESTEHILSVISNHLQDFSRITQEHFDKTVTVANDHVNQAVNKLGGSIEELTEKIDDLSDIVTEIEEISSRLKR